MPTLQLLGIKSRLSHRLERPHMTQPNRTLLHPTLSLRSLLLSTLALAIAIFAATSWAAGQDAGQPEPQDSVDRDYSDELPRIAPVEPSDALSTFVVAPGFRIELVASEPLVTDPIAIDFDPNGVLYAIEMRDYSEHPDENLGRVRRLVDENGDGVWDSSTIFAEGLSWPTAILCVDSGVLVGAPPELVFLRDGDGDGVAEERQIVMTGFGRSNVQGLMNSLRYGLDHRIHGATSSSGASLNWTIDSTNEPMSEPLELRGRDFAIDWQQGTIEPTAGGGQHGIDFDPWGDRYVCSNSDHLRYVRYEDRYLGRNPWFAAPAPTVSIAADGPQADVFRSSPVEPWRIVRTRLRTSGIVPGLVEGGGRPAGYFTGATGVTIYEPEPGANAMPWAIVADVGSNLIHRKQLTRVGNSYLGERIDQQSEFVASTDIWFRPVQFSVGPDGGLYVVDMYREVIEHPASLPEVIKRHLDLDSGRERGRIYRIVPDDFVYPGSPTLGHSTNEQLIESLNDPRVWHRRTATRLLIEQADTRVIAQLVQQFGDAAKRPEFRLHAMSVLDALGGLDETLLIKALSDENEEVRRWGAKWSERQPQASASLVRAVAALADDPSLRVRTQAAFSLGAWRSIAADAALAKIAARDFEDDVARVAVTTSLSTDATNVLGSLIRSEQVRGSSIGAAWLGELLGQVLARKDRTEKIDLLNWLERWPSEDPQAAMWLERSLSGLATDHPWREEILAVGGEEAMQRRTELLARLLSVAVDSSLEESERVAAIEELKRAETGAVIDTLEKLTEPQEPASVQFAAIEGLLARGESPEVAEILVRRWPSLSPTLRRLAMDGLLQRPAWILQVLSAIQEGRLSTADLDRSQLMRLTSFPDEEIQRLAAEVIDAPGPRDELIETYRPALELVGDAERGAAVFARVCANCHRVGEVGHEVGPSLESFRNRGTEALLLNVLDPNREINPQFLAYGAATSDGRQVLGMIDGETASSVTLKMAEGKRETIRRAELEAFSSTGVSLMPEGLEKDIDVQAMADLFEFLMQER